MTTFRENCAKGVAILFAAVFFLVNGVADAIVPSDVEPKYAEAVLAFQSSQFDSASLFLDQVLARYPRQREATELKALSLKALGKDPEAISLFKFLISQENQIAGTDTPYLFELGTLFYRQKDFAEARKYLTQSLDRKFNTVAAHYLLGVIDFQAQKFGPSEEHFGSVLASAETWLQAPAHFYLAEISQAANDRAGTVFHYYRAQVIAHQGLQDARNGPEGADLAKQVVASVDKIAGAFDREMWFGSVGLFTGYDSNVLFAPSNLATSGAGASGKGSFREILVGEVGFATSPMRDFQVVPQFRGAWNYNFVSTLKTGSYFTGELSLTTLYRPLAKISYGLHLGTVGGFRYTLDPAKGTLRYRSYNVLGTIVPYAKFALAGRWSLTGSLAIAPQRYFLDSETDPTLQKTGCEYTAEVLLRRDRGHSHWNPMAALRGSLRYTRGIEFRSRGLELEIGNQFYFDEKVTVAAFASINSFSYKARADGPRYDIGLSAGAALDYRLSGPISLSAYLEYEKNNSNIPSPYAFNRALLHLGAAYQF